MKRNLLLLLSLCLFAITPATEIVPKTRVETDFNSNWRFILADNSTFREPDFDDSNWRKLNVPHDWSIEGDYQPKAYKGFRTGFFPEGIGWYRKSFLVGAEKVNKQFVIQFDGVYMNSEVFVNGRYCGRHPYGYGSFQYDITEHLKFGQENIIAVRVDNSVPAGSRWYAGSGIYRNVHLIETNYVHFREPNGIFITTPIAEKERAIVQAEYTITASFFNDEEIKLYKKNKWLRMEDKWQNEPRPHTCTMRSIVYNKNGNEVSRNEKPFTVYNYNKHCKVEQEIEVNKPIRWSDGHPYTYLLKSEIVWNGKIIDDQVTRFGIRKLEFIPNKGMMVNGQRAIMKGVCLHHDGGAVGVAVPAKVNYYRLKKLKELGCNAIRTSHNPFSTEFYNLCDTMGFYVMDEILDEWTSAWGYNYTDFNTSKAGNAFAHHFNQWNRTELQNTIHRDRNHPSVVMWSVGNELPELRSEPQTAQKIAEHLIDICHQEDHTRPVTFGNNGPRAGFEVKNLDVLGFNYVKGNYDFKVNGPNIYEEDHKRYPDKLFVGTETSHYEVDYFTACRDYPYVIGQFIWTGIMYFGEVKAPKAGLRGWTASLLDMSLNMTNEGALFASAWNTAPKVYLSSSTVPFDAERTYQIVPVTGERLFGSDADQFTWNWETGGKKYVKLYSNCEEVELQLNGKSLGKRNNDLNQYCTEWTVDYEKGKLEALGYINGKEVSRKALITAEKALKITAHPYWKTLKRDGVDINIIEISIVDQNGNRVPNATNKVKVEVTGGAKLLAIDTGNLYYKGNFKTNQRKAANGYMTVTIQSNGKDEPVMVKLRSEGLKTAEIKL